MYGGPVLAASFAVFVRSFLLAIPLRYLLGLQVVAGRLLLNSVAGRPRQAVRGLH